MMKCHDATDEKKINNQIIGECDGKSDNINNNTSDNKSDSSDDQTENQIQGAQHIEQQFYVGIDIGSTASKTVITDGERVIDSFTLPTGWNGRETAQVIQEQLKQKGYAKHMTCVGTGYGRICIDYADKVVTEITCHGKGAWALFQKNCTVIDVGGQDTIAAGVIDSVASRVASLCIRHGILGDVVLTGGLCDSPYFLKVLSKKLGQPVASHPFGRYAGALGAALTASRKNAVSLL